MATRPWALTAGPLFDRKLTMNRSNLLTVLTLGFFILTAAASAAEVAPATIPIHGNGSATGFCQGDFGQMCMNQLHDQAEAQARQQADMSCQEQQGIPGFLNCFTNCNPPFLPPGHVNQFVSCNSNCNGNCQVP